jgi:putative hydrolase of HD superfamily
MKDRLKMESLAAAQALLIKPETVVQRQLEAYNARDLEGWLATYKSDAEQYLLHAGLLASGHEAIRKRMVDRFNDPALNAELVSRTVMDNIVIDHEFVTRTFPDGLETIEMLCIYEVYAGFIVKATFAIGQARPKV